MLRAHRYKLRMRTKNRTRKADGARMKENRTKWAATNLRKLNVDICVAKTDVVAKKVQFHKVRLKTKQKRLESARQTFVRRKEKSLKYLNIIVS